MNNQLKSNQRNFQIYQDYLDQTKDLFNNHNIIIKPLKNFHKNFANEKAKAFWFTKARLIAFCLDFLITIAIVIPLLAVGITCSSWAPSWMSQNEIITITFCLAIIPTLLIPLITWLLAQPFWLLYAKNFDYYKKIVIKLVDEQVINFQKFSLFPCAIGILMPTYRKGLPYKINYTSLDNNYLLSLYFNLMNQQVVNHNEIIKQIDNSINDVSYSMVFSHYFRIRLRDGFSLTKYFYFCAAIYQNYLTYQNEANLVKY